MKPKTATFYCSHPDCPARWRNFRAKAAPGPAKCPRCRRPAELLKKIQRGTAVYVRPDFPEHYNWSMGCVVKNRKHHEQLQRERGLQDWVPTRNSPGSQLSMGRRD